MIWIKNHGMTGESDNLRIPLANHVDAVMCHHEESDGCPAIAVLRGWTGVNIDDNVTDIRDGFETALGPQLRFAVDEPAGHDDYSNKSEELNALYNGSHPSLVE